jgi:AcrR family transcriptional regulator
MAVPRTETKVDDGPVPQAILAAATRLFASRGFDAASVREIAEAAGVAKPAIYYYFGNKEGLFDHLIEAGSSFIVERLKAINARPIGESARQCVEDAVWAFFEFAVQHSDLIRLIHNCVFGPSRHPSADIMEKAFGEVVEEFNLVVTRAAESGLVDRRRVREATMALRGVTNTYVFGYLHGRVRSLGRPLAAAVTEGFLHGYGAR